MLCWPLGRNSFIISRCLTFVNRFFKYFFHRSCSFARWNFIISLVYQIVNYFVVQYLNFILCRLHAFIIGQNEWFRPSAILFRKEKPARFLRTLPIMNGERGIWTLAPVARPTPLAGAPLRPLEYFSIIRTTPLSICCLRAFLVTQKLLYIGNRCLSIPFSDFPL